MSTFTRRALAASSAFLALAIGAGLIGHHGACLAALVCAMVANLAFGFGLLIDSTNGTL